MANNTRMNWADREEAVRHLDKLLSNIVNFTRLPPIDVVALVVGWNELFPKDYVAAVKTGHVYGSQICTNVYASEIIFGVDGLHDTRTVFATIKNAYFDSQEFYKRTGLTGPLMVRSSLLPLRANRKERTVGIDRNVALTQQQIIDILGKEQADDLFQWMKDTAMLYDELHQSRITIKEVFNMAKTAGQIKRMVPDLLQYLPLELRNAYQLQVRSSTLPFEWATYDKDKVERMTLTISKGHLLAGVGLNNVPEMRYDVNDLSNITWSRYGDWIES